MSEVLKLVIGYKNRALIFLFASLYLLTPLAYAESVKDAHTEVELVSEVSSAQPGKTFWAAIHFKMDPEWHVYWKNPGDSGLAPKIKWRLPEGFKAGEVLWPYPSRIDLPPLTSFGYEGEVLLMAPIEVPVSAPIGQSVRLDASLDWLACKVECIPGRAELSLDLPVSEAASASHGRWSKEFAQTRARIPLAEVDWRVRARRVENELILETNNLSGTPYELSGLLFFPDNELLIQNAALQRFEKTGTGYRLTVPLAATFPKGLSALEGVLVSPEGWRGPGSEKAWQIRTSLESAPAKKPMTTATAVFFAFLGGLILNLMPCVLPVLSLKILGFVRQAQENPKLVLAHGILFTLGVLSLFWVLAGFLIWFKSIGLQAGWGFQLQSPPIVAALAVLFLVLSLNLFGVFEIGLGLSGAGQSLDRGRGLWGAYWSGALATIVATPCTAPFMGAALGFALIQPVWVAFLVFTALGLGMATPVLILSARPRLLRWIPKPGPWMWVLKKILGLLLLATALWLFWVLTLQTGRDFFKLPSAAQQTGHIAWEAYSDERLNELRAAKRIVFIDFTAAWCLTCQVNERVALDVPKTSEAFKKMNVASLKADWTNQDEKVSRALERYGRNSIPFYVIHDFRGDEKPPVFLPEILGPSTVLEALKGLGYNLAEGQD